MRGRAFGGTLGFTALACILVSGSVVARDYRDNNHSARQDYEAAQSWRGGGRDYDNWRGARHRHDDWDRRGYWGARGGYSGWAPPPAVIWAPPPVVYYQPRRYRVDRFNAVDVIALGLFGGIVINALSENQRYTHERSYSRALSAPIGENIVWNDARAAGSVQVTRDGYAGDKYCREFQQTITVGGESQAAWGIACQEPDGSWKLVPN
jgi:surface antigen